MGTVRAGSACCKCVWVCKCVCAVSRSDAGARGSDVDRNESRAPPPIVEACWSRRARDEWMSECIQYELVITFTFDLKCLVVGLYLNYLLFFACLWVFLTRAMAVRSSSLMPFSIQAILNRKGDEEEEDEDEEEEDEEEEEKNEGGRRRLKELDMCFSKSACWKIFGGTHEDEDDAREDRDRGQREREKERARVAASHHKRYDSDSGLSEDHHHDHHHLEDEREAKSSSRHEQQDGSDSRALDESFQDETDRESTAAEQTRDLSDCELLASVSGKCLPHEPTFSLGLRETEKLKELL